jgi:hypothetical protein
MYLASSLAAPCGPRYGVAFVYIRVLRGVKRLHAFDIVCGARLSMNSLIESLISLVVTGL